MHDKAAQRGTGFCCHVERPGQGQRAHSICPDLNGQVILYGFSVDLDQNLPGAQSQRIKVRRRGWNSDGR